MLKHKWTSKVARYIAYCVDGGILCSQFTLSTFIAMLGKVKDAGVELILIE
jgi:hypothetical protein